MLRKKRKCEEETHEEYEEMDEIIWGVNSGRNESNDRACMWSKKIG